MSQRFGDVHEPLGFRRYLARDSMTTWTRQTYGLRTGNVRNPTAKRLKIGAGRGEPQSERGPIVPVSGPFSSLRTWRDP